jgi:hypothetical protein
LDYLHDSKGNIVEDTGVDKNKVGRMDTENWRKNRTMITHLQEILSEVIEELALLTRRQ